MKILAITQARYGSTRLPAKILKEVNGVTLLETHLTRILKSKMITKLIVATTTEDGAEHIIDIANRVDVRTYQGSLNDVLERFYMAAKPENPDYVVRLTSDCPLIDPEVIDKVINHCIEGGFDYVSNTMDPTYPDGADVEAFKFSALERAYKDASLQSQREHVTPYIWSNSSFKGGSLFLSDNCANDADYSHIRLTVDTIEDFEVIKRVIELKGADKPFEVYAKLVDGDQEIKSINGQYSRNEGYDKSILKDEINMGKGQKLYKKAKTLIPGGTMLLSKRPEMFLPENWPSYFSKAKGCSVWDLDGREYIDCSIMGIGTNTLGYGNEAVDAAVMKVVQDGNMSTFNCPEEVALAERLTQLDPWADMVRLARTGGEANSIAIRIARAASGKDKVAVCGYHGWHDWYLSANLGDNETLAGHLLPGLDPAGVPSSLRGMTLPFRYNEIDELADLVKNNEIGVIKMEVCRNMGPEDNFLQKVRQLATDNGIVLIFDECTSGFRETFGGLYKKYGVVPDMAIYSKTMGNGYGISAIVGKRSVMEAAQTTFISSTFWTERIGPTAALAAIDEMERLKSWEVITDIGLENKRRWQELADKYELSITQWGIPSLAGYTFNSENNLAYKTYITQEMLKRGYLASNSMYTCVAHTPEIINGYFSELEDIFKEIQEFENGRDVMKSLDGPICHGGFKRLN